MTILNGLFAGLMLIFGIEMATATEETKSAKQIDNIEIQIPEPDIPEPKDPTEG